MEPVADGAAFDGQGLRMPSCTLTDAATVTGHILYVDGGAHFGRW